MQEERDLERAFDAIAAVLKQSAEEKKFALAASAAEQHGLVDQGDGTPSQKAVWEKSSGNLTLQFIWRWYDQSHPFSIRPDMNILLVELKENGRTIRQAEERYED